MMTHDSFNFNLPGYRAIAEIYRDAKTVVYRAEPIGLAHGEIRSVAIKVLGSAYPTERELREFRHHYAIAKNLQGAGFLRLDSLAEYERGYVLVMEDFGGISLQQYCQKYCLSPIETIEIAIQLADILHALDRQQIVHKNIQPAHILIHPQTKQVKLIDFSMASILPDEVPEPIEPNLLAGTLAYLAPEQTGRMNRAIDYRTDFYALGVTLYELLTGKLPFGGNLTHHLSRTDANELIYAHLAQVATPVDLVNPAVPNVVAQIVAKLMAKTAEDRYQSARGLKSDLQQCLRQWQQTGTITGFELGQQDLSDRFSMPDQLYGREVAVRTLLDTFNRVATGSSELMLVAGGSGMGKTAVINEIHKPIVRQQGLFLKGKFDQFNRNLPLSAFVQAFRDLIGQLLSDSDAQLAQWKSRILAAVGENGRVLTAAIPELEQIIGVQPPVTKLAGTAAQNRFNWLFQKFIEIFTQPAHPLTIFLDDLQWVDAASLQLIKLLMESNGYLLLLGAYRDNEVSPLHPLMLMVSELQQAEKIVRTIEIAPLQPQDIQRLIADTLHCEIARSQPLAALIASKTQGNPFFIIQFLKALAEDGQLRFNPDGYWECDIVRIQALAITDDVVVFMTAQLQKLQTATQHALKLAACIGDSFDLQTLAIVCQQSQLATEAVLWKGLQAGLILPSSQVYKFDRLERSQQAESPPSRPTTYRFRHDRVQQAAVALIPAAQQQQTHLQIGRLLLANTPPQQHSAKLFEIVNHLNRAIGLIQEPAERASLARLNLQAARNAKAANAYSAAASYAQIGTEILGSAGWQQQYQLALALHETLADAAFLAGDFAAVPRLAGIVLAQAQTPIDRVKAYETMIHCHAIHKQYPAAIARGLEILQQLGIKLNPKPDRWTLLRELVKTKIALWGKSTDRLLALPVISDPAKIAKLRILDLLQAPAFFCDQSLMAVLSLVGIRLTLRDGNTPWAASFYATYCIVISGLGALPQTYRLGELANILADRFADLSVSARIKVVAAWYTKPWQEQLGTTIPMLDESVRMAIASGNLQYIGINAGVSIATRFYTGLPLNKLVERLPAMAELIILSQDENSQQFFDLMRQTIVNLQLPSDRPTEIFQGKDRISLITQWQASNEAILLSTMYGFQTLLAYHFDDIPNALIYADAQLPYEYAAKGGYAIARIWLFDALTRLAAYPASDNRVKQQLRKRIDAAHGELGKRARSMPENFQHQFDLVAAEKCRVLADFTQAIELYDRAISGARANKYRQEEALANELAAKFYLGWGKAKIAAIYMQEAYYGYLRWGAKAKTQDLEQRYPSLLAPIFQARQLELNSLSTLAKIANPDPQHVGVHDVTNLDLDLDLASVIQSAQALSGTIEFEDLIHQLSQIILKNAGAQTCIIALPDRDDEWQIRSISTLTSGTIVTTQLQQPLADSNEYPANLIYWVKNTRQAIAGDARQLLEVPDLYLLEHQPQSIFCLPIVDSSGERLCQRETVLGVLYLEHRHAPDMFADSKKTVISFLCTQAAIALANARLYQDVRTSQANLQLQMTERQLMEIALRESEQRYHQLVSNIPAALYQFELTTEGKPRLNYVSERFPELFEVLDLAVLADVSVLFDLVIPEDRSSFDATLHHATVTGSAWKWEGRIMKPSGQIKWIQGESRPMKTATGSIVWDGILMDTTDRKQAEIALRQSEERYQRLSDNIPGAIYQFRIASDGSINYPYISSGCWELFQLTSAEVMADSTRAIDTIHPEDLADFQRVVAESAQNMTPKLWEGRAILRSGEIKWIKCASRPELQSDGSIVWDGVMLDITEQQAALRDRKQAEEILHETNQHLEATIQELQQATHLKDEFLATMSHELRTPLNAILGMSEALEEQLFGNLNPRQLSSIATISKSGEHLLSLINDLLDVSKIAAGKLELNMTQVSLLELCKSSLLLVKQQAITKQIHLDSHLPVDVDPIEIDERRMRQVLINLLNNAIKFTNTGGRVRLAVWLATDADRPACLCFAITDTGIGISDADRSKLFQPFVQIDSRLSRKYTGTGLGLVLAKQIVELHGGRIVVESEVGFGSCFTVEIPQPDLAVAVAADRGLILARSSHTLPPAPSILLVEDNAVNIDTFTSYLHAKGYRTIVAHSGQQAISLAHSHHPDLILIDLHMSEDSIPTIEWIRHHSTQVYIPIIALATAVATTSEREQWLAAGADKYLAKPVKLCELHHTIQECLDLN
jgi:predicted ATPase/signal transduction histidine kinase/CheY-like chemotaxis protein/GAF domain-containing protein